MFKQLTNALSGSLTQASFSLPQANGINVSPGAVAKNFFGNVFASLSASQGFAVNSFQPGPSGSFIAAGLSPGFGQGFGTPQGTINSFRNIQNVNKRGNRALAPGSFVNSFSEPTQNPRGQVANTQFFGQNQFALSPLQGFAGQNGGVGVPGTPQFNVPTGFPGAGFVPQQTNSRGGILPLLIMPFIGLVTMVTSLFKVRELINSFKPVEVNTTTSYEQYKSYLDEIYSNRGSFDIEDEYDPERVNYDGPDISEFQNF